MRRYWWVNQTANYESELARGRLWASTNRNGTLIVSRRHILDMASGDLAFHYNRAAVRAVSMVREPAARTKRPAAYPKVHEEDPDRGWRVRVDVLRPGLQVSASEVARVLPRGTVLDKNGQVNRRYIFKLSQSDAVALARLARIDLPGEPSMLGRPPDEIGGGAGPTDAFGWARYRLEQSELRKNLLGGRDEAACGLCGEMLPAQLLLAAHIKPRRDCNDQERRDFARAAMLLCSLGCDVLFEWGFVVVDETGRIQPGRSSTHTAVRKKVKSLVEKRCERHDPSTAELFRARASSDGL